MAQVPASGRRTFACAGGAGGTMTTGQSALAARCWLTEPRSGPATGPRPREPRRRGLRRATPPWGTIAPPWTRIRRGRLRQDTRVRLRQRPRQEVSSPLLRVGARGHDDQGVRLHAEVAPGARRGSHRALSLSGAPRRSPTAALVERALTHRRRRRCGGGRPDGGAPDPRTTATGHDERQRTISMLTAPRRARRTTPCPHRADDRSTTRQRPRHRGVLVPGCR